MKHVIKLTTGSALLLSVMLMPVIGFAKEKVKAEAKSEVKIENRSCIKAFGHLFAKGWLKHNAKITLSEDCVLPFGIAKKFRGYSTTTPDTLAPVLTNVRIDSKVNGAVITWDTNEKADSAIFISTTTPVNTASTSAYFTNNNLVKDHRVNIDNLSASTTYYVIVRSKDASGNTSFSSQTSFSTKSTVVINDHTSPIIREIVGLIGTTTLKLGWRTDENATSRVYFSTTSPISTTTSYKEDATLTENHMLSLDNLIANTKYFLKLESRDAAGNTTNTDEFSLTTKPATSTQTTNVDVHTNIHVGL